MKKILTVFLTVLMMLSLCACAKKKVIKVTVVDKEGNNYVYSAEVKAEYLAEALYEMNKTLGLSFEMDEDKITEINGVKVEGEDFWQLMAGDKESDSTIRETKVEDGDAFSLIYTSDKKTEETPAEKEEEPVQEPEENKEETVEEPSAESGLLGGWEIYKTYAAVLENDDKDIFDKALEGLTGVSYKPVRVLATQLVSGLRYAYLAQGETMGSTPSTDYYIIVVYKDTDGYCELKSINKVEVPNVMTKDADSNDFTLSWTVREAEKKSTLPKQIQTGFEKVLKSQKDMTYEPLQLLATQLVNGTNYMALVRGKGTAEDAKSEIYLMTWNEDLQGNVKLMDLKPLNLNYYTAGE